MVFSYLQDKYAVSELFREVAVKVADRPGGYTRILRTGIRKGDNAEMCLIELVDFNETRLNAAGTDKQAKATTRRSRRGGSAKKKADAGDAEAKVEEAPKAEAKKEAAPKAEEKKEEKSEGGEEKAAE